MALCNIGASNAGDEFYRYKMPPIQSKIEGRGNGIKTNIVNMVDVAKALARPASYTTKYFGCELGAQSKFDEKTGTAIVNGAHDAAKLAQLLEGFIKRFVQCYACGNPETEVKIAKGETIILQCKACGNVSKVDMRHKLTTFILKNPPGGTGKSKDDKKVLRRAEQERMAEGEAIDKAEKAARKEARRKEKERLEELEKAKKVEGKAKVKKAGGEDPVPSKEEDVEEDDDDDVEWATDTSAAAMMARAKEQLTDASRAMVDVDGAKKAAEAEKKRAAEEAAKEAAERAAAQKQKELEEARLAAEKLNLAAEDEEEEDDDDDDDFDEEELIEGLTAYAAGKTPAQTMAFLSKLPAKDDLHRTKLLVFSLLIADTPFAAQIVKKKPFFTAVCTDGKAQLKLLIALEALLLEKPGREKEAAHVVKALYDEDLAEEDIILHWYDNVSVSQGLQIKKDAAASIRKKVQPVAEWLRTADEEDDDE